MANPTLVVGYVKHNGDPKFMDYAKNVPGTIKASGGKYLCLAKFGQDDFEGVIEFKKDEWTLGVLLEFENDEAAQKWKNSPEYQKILPARLESSSGPLILMEAKNPGSIVGKYGAILAAFVKVNDPKFADYPPKVPATLEEFGGEYIGVTKLKKDAELPMPFAATYVERTTGEDYDVCACLGFPTYEKAVAWYNSDKYKEIIDMRLDHSKGPVGIFKTMPKQPWDN